MNYIIGDIHGCGDELEALIKQILEKDTEAKFISVGDCFDRAFGANKVWQLIQKHNVQCILGNHERKMFQYLVGQRDSVPHHYHYALDQLFYNDDIGLQVNRVDFADWLQSLPLLIEKDGYLIAHGGVDPHNPQYENVGYNVYGNPDDWIQKFNANQWCDKIVVYGHKSYCKPHIEGRTIGIDTGACRGGDLTAYCLETKKIYRYRSGIDHFTALKAALRVSGYKK